MITEGVSQHICFRSKKNLRWKRNTAKIRVLTPLGPSRFLRLSIEKRQWNAWNGTWSPVGQHCLYCLHEGCVGVRARVAWSRIWTRSGQRAVQIAQDTMFYLPTVWREKDLYNREFRKTAFSPQSQSQRIFELNFRRLRVGAVTPSFLEASLQSVGLGSG